MTFARGDVVAGYTIEEVLGEGGMGTVYRARNPVLPRSDALKVLRDDYARDADFRTRFDREAELAATLDHPNIVAVHSRGETASGSPWIAMQYVEGSDAEHELRAGRMTPERAVRIVAQVGAALDYAHRRGVLHRDVKPANILLGSGDERILLADFGIARALDGSAFTTAAGTVLASLAYAAPETLSGQPVDGRADVYSLGCALFRMLTGTVPFRRRGGAAAVIAAHLTDPPPRVTGLAPGLPPALDEVIATVLAKDPAARYQTAGAFAAAAADALTASPEAGATPGPRRRVPVALLAAVLVGIGAAGGAALAAGVVEDDVRSQSLRHTHGDTAIDTQPHTVAALGPGDADAVLALGVQPVLITAPGGRLPSWERGVLTGSPRVMPGIDIATVAAVDPDVIIATGDVDAATYAQLSDISPTVTRPAGTAGRDWTWQEQLRWIARVLGRDGEATEVIGTAARRQQELRRAHPEFDGKTVAAVRVTHTGAATVGDGSPAADYLETLGFRYRVPPHPGTDVLIVLDPHGHGRAPAVAGHRGVTVVFADPDAVAALTGTGGYLATGYLDTTVVDTIAGQLR